VKDGGKGDWDDKKKKRKAAVLTFQAKGVVWVITRDRSFFQVETPHSTKTQL
jgi:hypothetical protein